MTPRASLISCYTYFLEQNKRKEDAFTLLTKELQTAPAESWSSEVVAHFMTSRSFRDHLDPNEPLLWQWIAKRTDWMPHGSRFDIITVLNCLAEITKETSNVPMFNNTPQETRSERGQQFLERVEKMAKNADPTRALYCGELLMSSRLGPPDPKRAIPWLLRAIEHKDTNVYLRKNAVQKLFEAYVATDDTKKAEKMLLEPIQKVHIENRVRFGQLALLAAKQGDQKTAIRNWRRAANCSLCDTNHHALTAKLRDLGLGDQIDAYYREVEEKLQ